MTNRQDKPVLITGASGALGRFLTQRLAEEGWTLRLSDMAPFPDALPERASFRRVDLADGIEVIRLVEGCGLVLHFGGASTDEWAFESVIDANFRGLYHVYEGARLAGARVVFASSNHAIGFHERSEKLDQDCALMPDSLYGLSKACGELLAQLYWMKHGVESVSIRIGSCLPEPVDQRMLSTWLSLRDLGRAAIACQTADAVGNSMLWGASNNSRGFWGKDDREKIGWMPKDSADAFENKVMGKLSGSEIAERYQGGIYTARG